PGNGSNTRITYQYFINTAGCGVTFIGCQDIVIQQPAYGRQASGKCLCYCSGSLMTFLTGIFSFRLKIQLMLNLYQQSAQCRIQNIANIMIDTFDSQIRGAQPVGEECCAQTFNDSCQNFTGRQPGRSEMSLPVYKRGRAYRTQLSYYFINLQTGVFQQ